MPKCVGQFDITSYFDIANSALTLQSQNAAFAPSHGGEIPQRLGRFDKQAEGFNQQVPSLKSIVTAAMLRNALPQPLSEHYQNLAQAKIDSGIVPKNNKAQMGDFILPANTAKALVAGAIEDMVWSKNNQTEFFQAAVHEFFPKEKDDSASQDFEFAETESGENFQLTVQKNIELKAIDHLGDVLRQAQREAGFTLERHRYGKQADLPAELKDQLTLEKHILKHGYPHLFDFPLNKSFDPQTKAVICLENVRSSALNREISLRSKPILNILNGATEPNTKARALLVQGRSLDYKDKLVSARSLATDPALKAEINKKIESLIA